MVVLLIAIGLLAYILWRNLIIHRSVFEVPIKRREIIPEQPPRAPAPAALVTYDTVYQCVPSDQVSIYVNRFGASVVKTYNDELECHRELEAISELQPAQLPQAPPPIPPPPPPKVPEMPQPVPQPEPLPNFCLYEMEGGYYICGKFDPKTATDLRVVECYYPDMVSCQRVADSLNSSRATAMCVERLKYYNPFNNDKPADCVLDPTRPPCGYVCVDVDGWEFVVANPPGSRR